MWHGSELLFYFVLSFLFSCNRQQHLSCSFSSRLPACRREAEALARWSSSSPFAQSPSAALAPKTLIATSKLEPREKCNSVRMARRRGGSGCESVCPKGEKKRSGAADSDLIHAAVGIIWRHSNKFFMILS